MKILSSVCSQTSYQFHIFYLLAWFLVTDTEKLLFLSQLPFWTSRYKICFAASNCVHGMSSKKPYRIVDWTLDSLLNRSRSYMYQPLSAFHSLTDLSVWLKCFNTVCTIHLNSDQLRMLNKSQTCLWKGFDKDWFYH